MAMPIRQVMLRFLESGFIHNAEYTALGTRCFTYVNPEEIDSTIPPPDDLVNITSAVVQNISPQWLSLMAYCVTSNEKYLDRIKPRLIDKVFKRGIRVSEGVIDYVAHDPSLGSIDWKPYALEKWEEGNLNLFLNAIPDARYIIHFTYSAGGEDGEFPLKFMVEFVSFNPSTFHKARHILVKEEE